MRLLAPLVLGALALVAAPASATLPIGAKAPNFATRGAVAGKVVKVNLAAELRRGPVVLFFFPAAFTGGCNAQANAFSQASADFRAAGATVIGMSADDVPTLQRFSTEKCAGKFAVASAGPALIQKYDVALGQPVKGRAVSNRTSYVIDRSGKIAFAHSDLNPAEHVSTTLAAVRRLAGR
ncbi:MAG: peroxiredoxin [Sphingomonas bacterium]|uniref:peroxiredoxin n=1 Tax=Sphingomonas bacterium TaxID=1895847 RepID=UPI0026123E7F|nr:redoxin domain-containing protein [Sphingomonas bacterium]MDB5695693.1 peroxiredoxin [Sphingomonas bacterium]